MKSDARITGKSGKNYFFQSHTIDNESDCFPVNIFLFAKLFKHGNTGVSEWVLTTKDKATYKLCLQSDPDADKDLIIEDLREDESYTLTIHFIKN